MLRRKADRCLPFGIGGHNKPEDTVPMKEATSVGGPLLFTMVRRRKGAQCCVNRLVDVSPAFGSIPFEGSGRVIVALDLHAIGDVHLIGDHIAPLHDVEREVATLFRFPD